MNTRACQLAYYTAALTLYSRLKQIMYYVGLREKYLPEKHKHS